MELTLHEAMIVILYQQPNKAMHNKDLAKIINKRGLYRREDNSNLEGNQIRSRARKYPQFFEVKDGIIYLR